MSDSNWLEATAFVISLKAGVILTKIAPAGYVLLDALRETCQRLSVSAVITCGNEGHPPTDPHSTGEAIDIRSHDYDPALKQTFLNALIGILGEWENEAVIQLAANQYATGAFFVQLENEGKETEHYHAQRRNATTYTVADLLA